MFDRLGSFYFLSFNLSADVGHLTLNRQHVAVGKPGSCCLIWFCVFLLDCFPVESNPVEPFVVPVDSSWTCGLLNALQFSSPKFLFGF